MKKLLLIAGIMCLIVCVLSLLISALSWFGYYHVLDGSAELYFRLHRRMIIFLVIGLTLAVAGTGSLILRAKL